MEDGSSPVANESASTPAPASSEAPAAASTPAAKDVSGSSSPASGQDVGGSSSPASSEHPVVSRKSLLDVVREAAPKRDAPSTQDGVKSGERGASPTPTARESAEDLGPLTQAEMDGYKPNAKKRITRLLEERDGLQKQIGPLQAQAKTTADLQTFLKQADIAKEDFGLLLNLGALMRRGDFRGFLEGVAPYVKLAQESLGIQLPPDLQQAVQTGHMTQDAARYVAQERSARLLAETRLTRSTQETTQRDHAEAVRNFQAAVSDAVSNWEKEAKKVDPDYARKEPVVRDLLHAVVQERGPPRSPAEAVEIARQAYVRANAIVSSLNPTRTATRQVPSSINRVNGALPQPNSLKEAVHQAIERMR